MSSDEELDNELDELIADLGDDGLSFYDLIAEPPNQELNVSTTIDRDIQEILAELAKDEDFGNLQVHGPRCAEFVAASTGPLWEMYLEEFPSEGV